MPMIKLIFNAHYLNFDDMVCSDRSFFQGEPRITETPVDFHLPCHQ